MMKFFPQKGVIAICTALTMPVLLGAVGLTVDFGNAYKHKAQLQNAADAAALAGVSQYAVTKNQTAANTTADAYAAENNDTAIDSVTHTLKDSVNMYGVGLSETVPMHFLKLFNFQQMEVTANAAAAYTYKQGLFERLMTFSTKISVDQTGTDSASGNTVANHIFYGNVAYSDNGMKDYSPQMNIGSQNGLIYQTNNDGTFETTPLIYDKGTLLYPTETQNQVNSLRTAAIADGTYYTKAELQGKNPTTNIDISQYNGKILYLEHYSNLLTISSQLTQLTYVVIDAGDSICLDVSNENSNNNLVVIYAPSDDALSVINAGDSDNIVLNKSKKAQSSIKLINTSSDVHTFEGVLYAPYGDIKFMNPNKAVEVTDEISLSTNGKINMHGCIVADRIEMEDYTTGNFTYNSKWSGLMKDGFSSSSVVTQLLSTTLTE